MDAPLGLSGRHALDAMHAGFEFEPREHAAAVDLGDDFLVAARRSLARRELLDLPAMRLGVALVHTAEIAGEGPCFVPAGTGAHFNDDAALVGSVFRQECEPQFAFAVTETALRLLQ